MQAKCLSRRKVARFQHSVSTPPSNGWIGGVLDQSDKIISDQIKLNLLSDLAWYFFGGDFVTAFVPHFAGSFCEIG